MKFKILTKINKNKRGFIAVTATMIVAGFSILYSGIILKEANDYSDSVMRREWRIQASLNAESCLDRTALMALKDYFLTGEVSLPELGCTASVTRNHDLKQIQISAHSKFNGVSSPVFSNTYENIP